MESNEDIPVWMDGSLPAGCMSRNNETRTPCDAEEHCRRIAEMFGPSPDHVILCPVIKIRFDRPIGESR